MSVNYYDSETGEFSPLSSAYRSLAIIDVESLPETDIQDAIYCVATDNYVKSNVVLTNDMDDNTTALEAIGFELSLVDGSLYHFTPELYTSIRYLTNTKKSGVSKVVINSADWSVMVLDKQGNPIASALIDPGMTLVFYHATTWLPVGITLSHTNMSTNTAALTSVGFSASQEIDVYTYKPDTSRFQYDNHYVEKIVINSTTGIMTITSPEAGILYDDIIVDGIYNFLYASALEYYVGSASRQTYERLAKATDMDVDELTDEQVSDLISIVS